MIQPNFNLFLWFILGYYLMEAILTIIFGIFNVERFKKSNKYDWKDVVIGFIVLIVLLLVIIT